MRSIHALPLCIALVLAACGGEDTTVEETAPATESAAEAAELDLSGVPLPEGVTLEMVQAGSELFPRAVCTACHGPDARGVEAVGPDLLDEQWINTDGSFDGIVETILAGVEQPKEFVGLMLPKGGNPALTDEQVRQLAAYIHAASRPRT